MGDSAVEAHPVGSADGQAAEATPPIRSDRLERLLPVIVLVPVAASILSALAQHWVVVSDGAAIMVRAGDVFRG
ncbi:MAG: hypothetical protein ACTHN0_18045, partial [Aquihabitans sp.]